MLSGSILLVGMSLGSPPALGQGFGDAERVRQVQALLGNRDFRVRVQACLSLGRIGGPTARRPLERALRDEQPAVRAAAAVGLSRLGNVDALPALRRQLGDSSPIVREQIESAIRALARIAPGEVDWDSVRVAIGVGNMANRTKLRGDEFRQRLRNHVLGELRAAGNVAIFPDRPDAEFNRQLTRTRLNRYFVEGTVSRLTRAAGPELVSIRCEVSLMVLSDPGRELRMLLSGAATSEESRDNVNPANERRMQDQALEGAVRSALSRLIRTLIAQAPASRTSGHRR